MNSVSYVLDLKDYDALTRAAEKKRSGRVDWILRYISPAILGFVSLFTLWLFVARNGAVSRPGQWNPSFWNVLFWFGLALYWPIYKAWTRYRFRKGPHFGSESHLTLSEKGVAARGVNGESLSFWSHIMRVETTDSHIFLFQTDSQRFSE